MVKDNYESFLSNYFVKVKPEELRVSTPSEAEVKLGLREELREYRSIKYRELYIKAYEVFKDVQLDKIVASKPTTKESLRKDCGLRVNQIEKFGDDIIAIVRKYLIE